MIQISLPLLLSLAAAFSPVFSAPARTHCRCILSSTSDGLSHSLPESVPAANSEPASDICADLQSSLEDFRRKEPAVFSSYLEQAKSHPSPTEDQSQPLSTSVLLHLAARHQFQNLGEFLPSAPPEGPRERIQCRSHPEPITRYEDSRSTLVALQIIVAMAFLACVAECVTLCFDWVWRPQEESQSLQLTGDEQRLMAYSTPGPLFSPGAEKKMQAYASMDRLAMPSSEKPCMCNAYSSIEEDDDDEINRPVM